MLQKLLLHGHATAGGASGNIGEGAAAGARVRARDEGDVLPALLRALPAPRPAAARGGA